MLAKAVRVHVHPSEMPKPTSNLIYRFAIGDPDRVATVDGVAIDVGTGEPVYAQTLHFHLTVSDGQCTVTTP